MTTCDICNKILVDGYAKIVGEDYGVCEGEECDKKAKYKVSERIMEHLETGRIDCALECCGDQDPILFI